MERILSGIYDTLTSAFSARNLPFFSLIFVLCILGTYFSTKVWTKKRAYLTPNVRKRWVWKVFRDSQVLHPMFVGAIWMAIWRDPMEYGWTIKDDLNYGFLAGALSLFPWVGLKLYLKRKYKVKLEELVPGLNPNSVRPTATVVATVAAEVEIPQQGAVNVEAAADNAEVLDTDAVEDAITPPGME